MTGRVLHFLDSQPTGPILLAVIYNRGDGRSRDEAAAIMALLGNGLAVGGLLLRPVLVEQNRLADGTRFGAVFDTVGVDDGLLAAGLKQRGIPCLTRHLDQVEDGHCTVAIRSAPVVSIVINELNATADGVQFATAFRMMVREI